MTFNTSTQLFIWCNMGFGDTLVMIPIINKVIEKYPDLKITVGVFKHHAYLFNHLPVDIVSVDLHFMVRYIPFDIYMPEFHHSICMWAGKRPPTMLSWRWKTFVDVFNIECQEKKLNYFLEYGENGLKFSCQYMTFMLNLIQSLLKMEIAFLIKMIFN